MTDAAIADATAGAPPLPAPLVPADGLPQSSSAGATDAPRGFETIASGDGGKIAEALAKAQGEIRNPGRGSENPHFKSKYTNLADGIASIRGPLSKHGIAWVQTTHVDGDFLFLTTSLIHAVSGETLDATWPVGAFAKLTPQQMGSALTYGKRYTLFSLVGIAGADEDDDGNAASGKGKEDDDPLIDADQLAQIQELLTETKSNLEIFFDTLGVSTFSDMSVKHYQRALVLLNEKKRRMAKGDAMTPDDRQAFLQARCGSVGASDVPNIIRRTKAGYSASRANLMALKVLERLTGLPAETYQSAAMTQGLEREPLARAAYGFMHNVTVEAVSAPGVIPHPLIEGAHASPDGTIGMLGLVEIKCPQPAAHLDTLLNEKIDNDYFVQMQWQMAVTGRHWTDYVSWSPDFPPSMQLWSERVERSPEVIDELEGEVRKFLAELEANVAELRKRYELAEAA